ncbi:MAG: outer membrane beta-barrel family protein [Bacteroidales bacterium]|nr:outer membrane beta-barrel family protein [Bacteroidales bacterium]
MRKKIFLLLVTLCLTLSSWAQQDTTQQKLQINGEVKDFLTQKAVDTMFVEIIKDGRSIDTADVRIWGWGNRRQSSFSFTITKIGNYQIRIWSPDFKTKFVPLNIDKFHKNEKFRNLPVTYLQQEKKLDEVLLDEVTITATRLKFFTNGDTLVYDATAFQMAQGSMLDALIKKLPGVEMKDGGEIYINGKKVDELQLNGRELLDSDKELFLENLPAYMIKNIATYEQTPREYAGTKLENTVEKETVMNVKMKREYSKGWIFNMEGGVGASMYDVDEFNPDKFLARLFASRFSDKSRLSMFANFNNLNDYRDPGEQGSWTPLSQSTGLMDTYKVGVTGNKYSDGDVFRYNGNGSVTYNESTTNTWGNGQQDINGTSSTYSRSYNLRTSYDTRIQTQHRFNFNQKTKPVWNALKNVFADANIRGSYHKYSNNQTDASSNLDADVRENWGKEWLDSLLNPQAGDLLKMYAVNRSITRQHGEGHDESVSATGRFNASPQYNDKIRFNANVSYSYNNQETPSYNHYLLEFPKNTQQNSQDLNRYNDNFENSNQVQAGAGIDYTIDEDMKHSVNMNVTYNYMNRESNRSLYLLHLLDGWRSNERELGMLPSVSELASTMDNTNSSYTRTINNNTNPTIGYSLQLRKPEGGGFTNLNLRLSTPIKSEEITYRKGGIDTLLTRTTSFLQPSISFSKNNFQKQQMFNISYNLTFSAPTLTQMVDLIDNSNPLNITHGNPNLENSMSHRVNMFYRDMFKKRYGLNTSFSFSASNNDVAMGYIYDPQTGVKISTPQNVDGNWNLQTSVGSSIPVDKDQRNVFNINARYGFTHSVDLSSTSNTPELSEVGTHNTEGSLRYDWKPNDKLQFGLNSTVTYRKSTSERVGFNELNVYDYRYGASMQAELWGGFQFSTDITMYSRRGYSGNDMNSDELVWNARVSKAVCKGKVTIMLDAFDLLHNLSNIRYSVNAQGHTETYSNVIPSYALLHVVWRFTKNKGDKGNQSQINDRIPEGSFPGGGRPEGGRPNGGGGFPGGGMPGGRPPMH